MARLKILFADDQIPNENLTEANIKAELRRKYPQDEGFRAAFLIMRQAVATLRSADYDVIVARTAKDALSLVRNRHFDLAIIDMGWFADNSIPENDQPYYGWNICEAIDEADRRLQRKPTPQIIYSNRFEEEPQMSIDAADKGKLPIYKIYNEAGHQALRASVKFIEHLISRPSDQDQSDSDFIARLKAQVSESLELPLKQQKQWFSLTVSFVAISISLLLVGALGAMFWSVQVGTITSISSILTGAISTLLYRQLLKTKKDVVDSRERALKLIGEKTEERRAHDKKTKP